MSPRRPTRKAVELSSLVDDSLIPKAREAEVALLGHVILGDGSALAAARRLLGAGDFFTDANRRIFGAMLHLGERGKPVEIVHLKDALTGAGELDAIGGAAYLGQLIDGVPSGSTATIEHYAALLKEKTVRRTLMERAILIAQACTNGKDTAELLEAGSELYRCTIQADADARRRCISTHDVMGEYAAETAKPKGRRLRTGIEVLDGAIGGIATGEVLTVVARPQVGKSALLSQLLVNAAIEGEPVVFFSLEMPRAQAFERLVQQRLGLARGDVERASKGNWSGLRPEQRAALNALAVNLVIIDRGKSGIADLDASMTEAQAILGRPPRLAAIDYLGLLGSGSKNLPLYQRVSEAAIDVKSFAKRHNVAVLLACQASRSQDSKRNDGAAPMGLDAARDSGQVEEAADFLVTLWRPELEAALSTSERDELRGQMRARLVKNRRGPLPAFRLSFDLETIRLRDWGGAE